MLQFSEQYNITYSVFLTFDKGNSKKIHNVYHSEAQMNKVKAMYPYNKFEGYTKSKFTITVLYVLFNKNPSSVYSVIEYLRQVDFDKEVFAFHNEITQYRHYISRDIQYITSKYGNPSVDTMLTEYYSYNIKFYTLWWYLKYTNNTEYALRHPLYNKMVRNIKSLLLYIKFGEESLKSIQSILNQSSLLDH